VAFNLGLTDRALHRSSPICQVILYNQVLTDGSPSSATRLEDSKRGRDENVDA